MEVRDCAKFVIEKVDDRNAERIMRTEILDGFVTSNRRPSDLLDQLLKKKKKKTRNVIHRRG